VRPAAAPQLSIAFRPLPELAPYARNSRTHSPAQLADLRASIEEFGWTRPVLADLEGIVAGHGAVLAAGLIYADGGRIRLPGGQLVPDGTVPVLDCTGWTPTQRRAYVIADNSLGEASAWDDEMLAAELRALEADGFNLDVLAFDDEDLAAWLEPQGDGGDAAGPGASSTAGTKPEEAPEGPPARVITRRGDLWLLGRHRLLCGDSTSAIDVERLVGQEVAPLLHADPPYGMGKAADGVLNDNLYREKLDAFQAAWWFTWRVHLADNASAYVWGNAPDLWRWWYGPDSPTTRETVELRNELVWDKRASPGMASDDPTAYVTASERCLFFQLGRQFLGNVNASDFPDAWEPIRARLEAMAQAAALDQARVRELCGVGMYGHWFTRSQFTLVPEKHYAALAAAAPHAFTAPWAELKAEWDRVKGNGTAVIAGRLEGMRSYFDNTHAAMYDVWGFPRVVGDDRFGHATPKPVAMMARALRSSCPDQGLVLEPFAGTGSTLMAAEETGRRCFTMELSPAYVDVVVRRWQKATGGRATLEGSGEPYEHVADARADAGELAAA
jgi:hypothetical protein